MTVEQIRQHLVTKTVGIAGCGGLGSNCAAALVRTGIGKLILADFDMVSESNLNRQYFFRDQIGQKKVFALQENLLRINPEITLEIHDRKLDPAGIKEIFATCDVVVEAFDAAIEKQMLIETILTLFPDRPLVIGNGMAGWGKTGLIHVRKEGNLYICGDEQSEISEELPPLAPRVGIVANMQANVVLEVLLDGRTGGRADGRTSGQADKRTGGQADKRTGGQADKLTGDEDRDQ